MVEIIGKVGDIAGRSVEVVKLRYQELVEALREGSREGLPPSPETLLGLFLGPKLTLKFSPEVVDSLVEHAGGFCRLTVRDGVIVKVATFKKERELLEEVEGLLLGGKGNLDRPESFRDKAIAILSLIDEMQAVSGMAERSAVLAEAGRCHGMAEEEAQRVIRELIRDGAIYEPRAGFLRVTVPMNPKGDF